MERMVSVKKGFGPMTLRLLLDQISRGSESKIPRRPSRFIMCFVLTEDV